MRRLASVFSIVILFLTTFVIAACQEEEPTITFNSSEFIFSEAGGDQQSVNLTSNAQWKVVYHPEWLTVSPQSGSEGTSQISMRTTGNNLSADTLANEIQFQATIGQEKISKSIRVKQLPAYKRELTARVNDDMLIMSHGIAAVIVGSGSIKTIYYYLYPEQEWQSLSSKESDIEAAAKTKWYSYVVTSSAPAVEHIFTDLQPDSRYHLVTLSYSSANQRGTTTDKPITTKTASQPTVVITPETTTVASQDGSGKDYKWSTTFESPSADKYYVYACASADNNLPTTMTDMDEADFGKYNPTKGMAVAWGMYKLYNQGEITDNRDNDNPALNGEQRNLREQIYMKSTRSGSFTFPANDNDKYLQIVAWAATNDGQFSGIITDMVYHVDNGVLRGGEEETHESGTHVTIANTGGSFKVSVSMTESWKVVDCPEWCHVNPTSGGSGTSMITITCDANNSSDAREGKVIIRGVSTNKEKTITITQKGREQEQNEITINANGVQFKMIKVEGGTFQMGGNDDEAENDEKPVHRVTLSDFYIGQTEVTQALWYVVMGYRPTSGGKQWTSTSGLGDDYPAYLLSWNDCQEFIEKLNRLTGHTFRMPTEAEWEYAARGGNKSLGYKYSGSNTIGDVAWYSANSYDKGKGSPDYGAHRVATKQPNELGIYDMSGNVHEWCSDWYGSYSSSAQTNPTGPSSGSNRVFRGGCWFNSGVCSRVAIRGYALPTNVGYSPGLRLAREVEDATPTPHTSASPSTLTFEAAADNTGKTIQVTSNESWTAKSDATWCKVTPASGSNNGAVTVTVTANTSTAERTAHVTIKGTSSNGEITVKVTQKVATSEVLTFSANGVQFKMIKVEGGTFQMGATSEQGSDAYDNERPVHSVTLSTYYIGQTEVTQALWYAVMGYSPTSSGSQWTSEYGLGDEYPAYNISWNDCQTFIEKLNSLTGRTFRMPTEAEWEYAARGGNVSRGYKYSGSNTIGDVAWYEDNSGGTTHKVSTKQPNELGIYDMSGNVWEWCGDWYGKNYYLNSPSTNPNGPSSGSFRVFRGGSWDYYARYCRVAYRYDFTPTFANSNLGLRLAL